MNSEHWTSPRAGFFISPEGQVVYVPLSHIESVISDPATFGQTVEGIHAIYREHGEILPEEGVAREMILRGMIRAGWIRVRGYGNQGYTINAPDLSATTLRRVGSWAQTLLQLSQGQRRVDPSAAIHLKTFDAGIKCSLCDLATPEVIEELICRSRSESEGCQ